MNEQRDWTVQHRAFQVEAGEDFRVEVFSNKPEVRLTIQQGESKTAMWLTEDDVGSLSDLLSCAFSDIRDFRSKGPNPAPNAPSADGPASTSP